MKIKRILPILIASLLLIGCKNNTCSHIYNESYSYNEEYHWHDCGSCDSYKEKYSHQDKDQDGLCDICGYNLYFKTESISNDECQITGYNGKNVSVLSIPSVINEQTVTSIADNAFFNNSSIEKIVIPSGVTTIGSSVFEGCTSLTTVVIPSTVTKIGVAAFSNTSLKTVEYKGTQAQYSSIMLLDETIQSEDVDVTTECEHTSKSFQYDDSAHWYVCDNTDCGEIVPDENGNLRNPHNLVQIDYKAPTCTEDGYYEYQCSDCGYISKVLENKLGHDLKETIEKESTCTTEGLAKYECQRENCDHSYTSVLSLKEHTTDGTYQTTLAYHWQVCEVCNNVVNYELHSDKNGDGKCDLCLEELGDFLYTVDESSNTIEILKYVGQVPEDKTLIIPQSVNSIDVTSIACGAFMECTYLECISIPFVGRSQEEDENTHFGYIFGAEDYKYNNSYVPENLKKVIITNGKIIDSNAFYMCYGIEEVNIESTRLHTISKNAFEKCYSLKSIGLPSSLTTISEYAFEKCLALESIEIPSSVEEIGQSAFLECSSLKEITLPFIGNKLNGSSNTHFGYIFGSTLYSNNKKFIPSSLINITLLNTSQTSIASRAFFGCNNIESIIITDNITSLGSYAFSGCTNLIDIKLSNNITTIEKYTFQKCYSLESIILPNIITIEEYAFSFNTSLNKIVLPSSITTIKASAFSNTSSLDFVCYEGSVSNWNSINKEESGNEFINIDVLYLYSETEPAQEGNYWYYNDEGEISIWNLEEDEPSTDEDVDNNKEV